MVLVYGLETLLESLTTRKETHSRHPTVTRKETHSRVTLTVGCLEWVSPLVSRVTGKNWM